MTSVILPTKHRPEKLERMVKSIDADCKIFILAFDKPSVTLNVIMDERVQVCFDDRATVVEAFNMLSGRAVGHIHPTSDDVEYLPNAIQTAEQYLNDRFKGNGVVGFNVINMTCNDDAFVLVGQEFFKNNLGGQIFHHEYEHFFADTELGDYAKGICKFETCEEAQMKNYHPAIGNPPDATHMFRRGLKLAHDREVYLRRKMASCGKVCR